MQQRILFCPFDQKKTRSVSSCELCTAWMEFFGSSMFFSTMANLISTWVQILVDVVLVEPQCQTPALGVLVVEKLTSCFEGGRGGGWGRVMRRGRGVGVLCLSRLYGLVFILFWSIFGVYFFSFLSFPILLIPFKKTLLSITHLH